MAVAQKQERGGQRESGGLHSTPLVTRFMRAPAA
jgi:hypothetical protein